MAAKKTKTKKKQPIFSEIIQTRLILVLTFFLMIIGFLKLGAVGLFINYFFDYFFGQFSLAIYIMLLIGIPYYFIKLKLPKLSTPEAISFYLIVISALVFISIPTDHTIKGFKLVELFFAQDPMITGGLIGSLVYGLFSLLFDYVGTLIACALLVVIAFALLFTKWYLSNREDMKKNKETKVKAKKEKIVKPVVNKQIKFFDDRLFDKKEELETPVETPKNVEHSESKQYVINNYSDEGIIIEEEDEENTSTKDSKNESLGMVEETMTLDFANPKEKVEYQLPSVTLLQGVSNNRNNKAAGQHASINATKLVEVLKQFGVNVEIQNVFIGPSVTKYEITLEIGTRVNKIIQLQDDIKLALAAKDIRIEAPIPGKSAIGVEIPNLVANTVSFKDVLVDIPEEYKDSKLVVPLGKDVTGNAIYAELNKMPHLLIAGATGSGKSVCVNTIICSILMRATPDEVKLLLVDPKKVELSHYNGIAHLLSPVVTDPKKASVALRMIVEEMERRYDIFAKHNAKNIAGYNEMAKKHNVEIKEGQEAYEILPFIVVILDEVADLMMVASKDVEDCIMRISQMARAAGIHLIVATQRPSTDVITGVIKANIPSRIAFAVSSSVDSRTILDASGAEKLLGKGDMLFSPMGSSHPVRVQGAFVSDDEVNKIVYFVTKQMQAKYEDKFANLKIVQTSTSFDDQEDEEYEEARQFVIVAQKASASLLQRQFRIGYNKAARIIDQLESDGIIGPQIGSKPREVLVRGYTEEDI